MKGLSIEEKAQAYDRAVDEISKLRDVLLKEGIIGEYGIINISFERIFPELKESEDERIRKQLIAVVELYYGETDEQEKKDCLAWLEKQCQVKDSAIYQHENETCKENGNSLTSEDIRKGLIQYFNTFTLNTFAGIDPKKILSWLEKQGEQNLVNTDLDELVIQLEETIGTSPHSRETIKDFFQRAVQKYMNCLKIANGEIGSLIEENYRLKEKQDEQKSNPCENCDNVRLNCQNFPCIRKRAFEQGKSVFDVIDEEKVDNQNCVKPNDKTEPKFHKGDWVVTSYGKVNQVVSVDKDGDGYTLDDDVYFSGSWCDMYHLWTIEDAKDGDVLAWDDSKCIALFKSVYDKDSFRSYGYVGHCTSKFETVSSFHSIEGAHPATKEQRDTLMKAIADAGYTFNFEKKELDKIESNSTWNEEDEINYNYALAACIYYGEAKGYADTETHQKTNNWLKSLKERYTWKPSKEQFAALFDCQRYIPETNSLERKLIGELYQDLKKLKA